MTTDPIWASVDTDGTFVSVYVKAGIEDLALHALVPELAKKRNVEATELGAEHLDTVTTPGTYTQSANLEATLESGYPATRGGVLQVERSVSKTMVWQTYTTYAPTATTPPQTWHRGSYNGDWSAWEKIGGAMPDGGQPGQVLTTGPDGKAQWDTATRGIESITQDSDATKATVTFTDDTTSTLNLPSGKDGANWSKDQQAKAQGYWIVVSPTEPESGTYTTADGTVVPVVWQKPIEVMVPVIPEAPYFDKYALSIQVASLVGVDYYLTGFTKDGATVDVPDVKIPDGGILKLADVDGVPGLPYTVNVVAKAEPGYVLPSSIAWTYSVVDPKQVVLVTSDTFTGRADGTLVKDTISDAVLGGTAKSYASGAWQGGENWRVQGEVAQFDMSGKSAAMGFTGVGRDVRIEFDLTTSADFKAGRNSGFGVSGNGETWVLGQELLGISEPYEGLWKVRVAKVVVNKVAKWDGHYILELFGDSVIATVPGLAPVTVPVVRETNLGKLAAGMRVTTMTGDVGLLNIDNLKISRIGG